MVKSSKITQWMMDGALVDTPPNGLSSVRLPLYCAARNPNIRTLNKRVWNNSKSVRGVGVSVLTLEALLFPVNCRGRECSVYSNLEEGSTAPVISPKDMAGMGHNCETYYKIIDKLEDGHRKIKEERLFTSSNSPQYDFLTTTQR